MTTPSILDATRVALMNAGSLLKEKLKRLGQSNLSEEQKAQRTPVKAKPEVKIETDTAVQQVHKCPLSSIYFYS